MSKKATAVNMNAVRTFLMQRKAKQSLSLMTGTIGQNKQRSLGIGNVYTHSYF